MTVTRLLPEAHPMPSRPPLHHPAGWKPVPKAPPDAVARSYGTAAWRRTALAVIARDNGRCFVCGKEGATVAHHLVERRNGGTDDMRNLVAVHHKCHARCHPEKGWR